MNRTAIITGITGQDGGYLAKFLLGKGYRVCGAYRRASTDSFVKLREHGILEQIEMINLDLTEFSNICRQVQKYQPDEFYNLAAQSFVASSFEEPIYTTAVNAMGVLYILEAIRQFSPKTRLYQASTSEMFGKVQGIPQRETTPFYPRSPYGCAKLFAHNILTNYRESFGINASSGILFNHESPMRGKEFVTRKITAHFARIFNGDTDKPVELGNISAQRDWGFSGDYVEGMWQMLQQPVGDTFILATGETHTIREFCEETARICGWDLEFSGENEDEIGIDKKTGRTIVCINPKFFRPAEVDQLLGDSSRAKKILGWEPKVRFPELCRMMMEADIERSRKGIL
ncbi:MAG: GDP-mannose 4,6-dehydratase [Rickettsiales bacterium]|jgi:GDPmannose 4,6-dehydratase|nr:GDP-mannose 4,6-dehydratase [Rickettsiales bacterium]